MPSSSLRRSVRALVSLCMEAPYVFITLPPPVTASWVHHWQVLTGGRPPFFWKRDSDVLYYRGMLNGGDTVKAAAKDGTKITPWLVNIPVGSDSATSVLIALEELMLWCLTADASKRPTLDDITTILASSAVDVGGAANVTPASLLPHEYDDTLAMVRSLTSVRRG
jgi:hypothetical protein